MKRKILTGIFAAALSIGFVSLSNAEEKKADKAAKPINSECPMSGQDIGDATSTVEVGFCCNNCKGKFTKNPGKYMAKAAAAGDKCPMSGKEVKTKTSVTVGFCCNKCKGKFDKDAQANLAKVKPAS